MSVLERALTGLSGFAVRHPWIAGHRTLRLFFLWDASVLVPNLDSELSQAVAVIALPFGSHDPDGCLTGPSNRKIARITDNLRNRFPHLRTFSQWEVPTREVNDPGRYGRATTTAGYLEELLEANPWLRGEKVILVAHPWHFFRSEWLLENVGMTVLTPVGIDRIPWDSLSGTQKWVKSPQAWLWREVPARIVCRLVGVRGIIGRLAFLIFRQKLGMSSSYIYQPSGWL